MARVLAQKLLRPLSTSRLLPGRLRPRVLRRCGLAVGDDALIQANVDFTGWRTSFGTGCLVGAGSFFDDHGGVTVGDGVWMAAGTRVLTVTHDIGPSSHRAGTWRSAPVRIEDGAWLGAGSIILPGVTVARGCVVAAGAVVTRDTEPDGLYVGSPARRTRELDVVPVGSPA